MFGEFFIFYLFNFNFYFFAPSFWLFLNKTAANVHLYVFGWIHNLFWLMEPLCHTGTLFNFVTSHFASEAVYRFIS